MLIGVEPPPVEPSKADLRRSQVLDAATKCFSRRGFHGASMADLAAEADMSVGQIYRYFANKEAIIAAIVERDMAEAGARVDAIRAAGSSDVVEELIEIAKFKIERIRDSKRAALFLEILAEAARNPRMADIVRGMDQAGRARLLEALARNEGPINQECLETRLDMVAMLFDGWVIRSVKNPEIDTEAYIDALRPMFRILIYGPDAACG